MKGFRFPLDKVLAWRQTQQTMAEAALALLLAEHRAIHEARANLQTGRVAAQLSVARAPANTGTEIAKLEAWRTWTLHEDRRLSTRLHELEKAIDDQKLVLAAAARNVKMLERLRTRRESEWEAAVDHETETQAAEWAVTQWQR